MDYYLKANIHVEPLIWHWYAHPLLIPPANCGMMLASHYIRIMESFIDFPEMHKAATKNPKLAGGSFIDLEPSDTLKVQDLLNIIKEQGSSVLSLAEDLKSFDKLLQTSGEGYSLENLYQSIPDSIKGCVELVYDSHNHPMIRLIEAIIYKKYYQTAPQSILLSHPVGDARSFVLSTPRFAMNSSSVNIPIAFNDERLDILLRSRLSGHKASDIMDMFDLSLYEKETYKDFFDTKAPLLQDDRSYIGERVRVRYLGHACILLQSKLLSILIDPVIPYKDKESHDRFTYLDLPDVIDYVLITHAHQDHISIETLIQIRHKVKNIVIPSNNRGFLLDPSLKLILKNIGFHSLIQLDEFDEIRLQDGYILSIPFLGEHGDLNIHTKSAYCINLKNHTFLFAADSNVLDENLYRNIYDYIGKIDTIFLGMECIGAPMSWVYSAFLTQGLTKQQDQSRRLSGSDAKKALALVSYLRCSNVYVYAMGMEPWLSHIMAIDYSYDTPQITEAKLFISEAQKRGISSSILFGKSEWVQ